MVPSLLIQPLVENAIRHGVSKKALGGSVTLSAEKVGNELEIRVLDDGVGLPPQWTLASSAGVGLSVTRERIASLHPNGRSQFTVERRDAGGTEVKIMLPLRATGQEADDDPRPSS
jgi:two-component system LytT family sensor kinase